VKGSSCETEVNAVGIPQKVRHNKEWVVMVE
jgi:hypothetical protein